MPYKYETIVNSYTGQITTKTTWEPSIDDMNRAWTGLTNHIQSDNYARRVFGITVLSVYVVGCSALATFMILF